MASLSKSKKITIGVLSIVIIIAMSIIGELRDKKETDNK